MKENNPKETTLQCFHCHGPMKGSKQNYKYTECGLSSVVLVDIVVYNCPKCGAIVPEIQNVDALHSAIALNLLKKNGVLVAEEIRFLRSMADYSATHLAKVMGVAKQTLSRWENAKAVIGIESDRLLRFACLAGIAKLERPDMKDHFDRAFDVAKHVKELNLPKILAEMDSANSLDNEPQQIRLRPDELALLVLPEASSSPERSAAIQ